jgi:hypothetical protein
MYEITEKDIKKAVIEALRYYLLDAYLDQTGRYDDTEEGFADHVIKTLHKYEDQYFEKVVKEINKGFEKRKV